MDEVLVLSSVGSGLKNRVGCADWTHSGYVIAVDKPRISSMARGAGSWVSGGGVSGTAGGGGVVGQDRGYLETGLEKFSLARDSLRAWLWYAFGETGGLVLGTSTVVAVPKRRSSLEKFRK